MRWHLATDQELWNIIENDWDVPLEHIEGLVTESLNRKLFDHLIKHLINKMFNRYCPDRRYNFYDLFSMGYIGVVVALKNYRIGKGSFKTFAYMNIKTEFLHHIEKTNSEKRKVYENIVSLDKKVHEDNESSFLDSLVDKTNDPEKIVINKLFWTDVFQKITPREKEVLIGFAQGFSMQEMARNFKITATPIHRAFHRGIHKINPSAGKVDVKGLGLMTRTKVI